MTFSSNVQGLVLLAFLMCIPHSLGEPWPKSQFGQSGDSDVHIQKSGVVRHTAGEGLSVTDTGIYRLRSRESKYHENYKVSQDPDERPLVRESLPSGSPWQQEVVEEEEEVEEVDLRDASQEELLAYMEQRNKVLERALGEALNQRSPDYVAGTRVVPSHYGAERQPHTRRRRPLILPVKVLVNTPEGGQGGYPHSGGPGLANGTNSPLDSRGGRNPADPFDRNNETPEWIRRLQGTDSLPVAPETNINPLQSPRSSTGPYSQQRGGGSDLSTPDPWIKQNSFPRGGQDPRTNQGRSQDNNSSPQGINRLTTQDPWINMNKNQGTGNQGRNAFLNTNQNQGTNQDPWKNTQGPQGTNSYPFSNQGRNQGTNHFTGQRGNQGTTNAYSFNNQNRNQAPRTGPWVNVGKNQGTSIFPQANQGRIQGINRYPQRTNTSPFTNQGKNPGGSPFPSRNQGNNPYPSPNQGQPIDSLPLPSQLPNFFPPITQGQNQGTNFLPLPTQGQRQQLGPIPLANQNRFQTTTTYPSANQGRNQGSYVTTNQRRNQGRNAFTSPNQRRNQNTNSGRWSNRGRNQATGTNAWKNEARNQGNTQSNTGPSNNKNTNQGTARSNSYSRSNQRNTRGRNSQSIYPGSTSYQNTRETNSPYPRSPFRKQNDFSNAWPTKNPDTNLEGSDKKTSSGDDNHSADESPTSRSKGQSIFSHINDKTDSLKLNSRRRSLNQYTKEPAKDQQSTNSPTQTPHTQPPSQRIIYTSPKINVPFPSQSTEPQQPKSHPPLSTKLQKDKSPVGSVPKKQNKEQSRSPYSPPPEHNKPTPIAPTFETIPSRKRRNVQQPKSQPLPSTTQPQGDKSSVNSDPKKQTKKQRKSPYSPPPEHTKPTPNTPTSETIPSRKRRNVQQPKSQPLQSTTKSKGDKSPDRSDPKKQNNEQRKSPYSPPPEHNQPTPDAPTSETIPNRKRRHVQQPESQPMPSTTKPKGDKSSMSSVPKKQNKEQSRSPYSPPPEHNEPTPNAPTSETIPSRKRRDMQQPESQPLPSTTQPQEEKSSVNSDPKKQTKEHRKSPYSPPPEHHEPTPNAPTSETIPSRKRRDMQQPESQPLPSTTQPQGDKSSVNSDPKKQTKEHRKSPYSPPPEHNEPTPNAPTSETIPSRKRRDMQQPESQPLPSTTQPQEEKSSVNSDPKNQTKEQRKSPYSPPPEHNKPTPDAPTSETTPSRKRRNVQQPKSQPLLSTKSKGDKSPESSDPKKQINEQRKSPYSPPPEHNKPTPIAPTSETILSRKRRNMQQPQSQHLLSTTKPKGDKSSVSSDPKKQTKEQRKSPYSPPPEHNKPTPIAPTSETIPGRQRRNVQQLKSQSLPSSTKPEEDNLPESSDAKKQNKEQRKSPYSPPPEHNQPTPTAPISETIPSRKRRNVQQPKSHPLPSTKSKGDKSPESSDPQKQTKEQRKSPYSPPPEHNQPTPNTPTSETFPSRKRRNVQPFEDDYNQGPPPPPARNGYAGHSPSDYNHDDPFMTSEDDNRHDGSEDSQYYDYPTGPYDTDGNQQRNKDLPGREVHGKNPNFKPRPGLKYYNYQPTTQFQRNRPPPPTRTYPSLESNPPPKNKHRTFDDREQKNPPRENKPRQNDDHKEKIGDEGRHVHGVNPNFKPTRKQKLRPKQYYRHKHRPSVPYTDSSVQMHPSLRRKRDVSDDNNEHINIHLSPRPFETRVIISSPLEVERFKNKRSNAEENFPSGNFPNFPSITAYRGSYASSGRERNVRSSALRKETKDSRGFVGHRVQGEGSSGEPVSRATSRARFSKSRYAPAGSTYYKAGASSRDSRRISSRQRSQKPRYNDGYGYSNRYNPRYAHVLGGGGRGRGGGGVYIYSPSQNSGYGSRRRRGGGAGYHRNQRGGGGGGRYDVPVIENGITALVQIFNNSEDKGAVSGTKGGSSQQTGSHFLYNPSTEDLQLVSDSATNGVSTQDDLEGAYFQYNPNTEELKLVTSKDQFVSDVDKASNDSRGRNNQIKSNSVPKGSYIQYNTDTHELKLKPGSDSSRSSISSIKNNNQGSQGAFFTYDPATQKLKLSKDTGTGATNSNSPYQAKVPSSPFSGSKGSQLVGLIQLENNKAKEGGTSGNNGGYLQFDPSNSGTTTTSNQQNPQGVQGGIEEIKIFVQDDAGGGTAKQNPQQKVVGYVVVDGGSATFLAPNPGPSGGYIQFSPVGAGAGTALQGGGGTDQYLTHKNFANRPLVKPGPDLFLRMFTEGEVFLESDAIVQNFYTDGDVRRMVSHFRALPLEQSRMGSGFMTGRLKGYHVTACRQCGPSNRPMIEFVTLYDASPKVVRRFHYRMRRYGRNVGWSSSTHPYADGKRQPSLYFGTYPYKNQPQFGVPRFRNQLFDDLSAKKQNKNKNSGRQRRE